MRRRPTEDFTPLEAAMIAEAQQQFAEKRANADNLFAAQLAQYVDEHGRFLEWTRALQGR